MEVTRVRVSWGHSVNKNPLKVSGRVPRANDLNTRNKTIKVVHVFFI
jgi:hypothetical protein